MFYSVYEKTTGKLISTANGTRKQLANPMPSHLDFTEQQNAPDMKVEIWSTTTLTWISKPSVPPTRLEKLRKKKNYTPAERDEILNILIGGGR